MNLLRRLALQEKKKLDDSARLDVVEITRASLTCFRTCFIPGRAKDLSAPRVKYGLSLLKLSHKSTRSVYFSEKFL